jgi:D-aspartate ligase
VATDPPAVVIGGAVGALSVTRSLARKGIDVYVLSPVMHSPIPHSRFPVDCVTFDDKQTIQDDWLAWLAEKGPAGAALLPCDDDSLELIARNRARLVELGYRPFEADDGAALATLDKNEIHELAEKAGVAAPVSVHLREPADLEEAVSRMEFPCALKPLHSHLFARHYSVKAIVVQDAEDLRRTWAPMQELGLEVLATEIINPASEECVGYMTYLDERGEPLFHFTKAKIRQYPIRFGLGSYHVSRWTPDVADAGLRFFQSIGARGLAYVEFKRATDGTPKIVDVNHRFLDSTEVVRRSGIDIAQLVYDRLTGRPIDVPESFRDDVRLWFAVEDTRAFFDARREGRMRLREWAGSLAGRQHFPIFAWDDPLPSLTNVGWMAQRLVRRAGRRG